MPPIQRGQPGWTALDFPDCEALHLTFAELLSHRRETPHCEWRLAIDAGYNYMLSWASD